MLLAQTPLKILSNKNLSNLNLFVLLKNLLSGDAFLNVGLSASEKSPYLSLSLLHFLHNLKDSPPSKMSLTLLTPWSKLNLLSKMKIWKWHSLLYNIKKNYQNNHVDWPDTSYFKQHKHIYRLLKCLNLFFFILVILYMRFYSTL